MDTKTITQKLCNKRDVRDLWTCQHMTIDLNINSGTPG